MGVSGLPFFDARLIHRQDRRQINRQEKRQIITHICIPDVYSPVSFSPSIGAMSKQARMEVTVSHIWSIANSMPAQVRRP